MDCRAFPAGKVLRQTPTSPSQFFQRYSRQHWMLESSVIHILSPSHCTRVFFCCSFSLYQFSPAPAQTSTDCRPLVCLSPGGCPTAAVIPWHGGPPAKSVSSHVSLSVSSPHGCGHSFNSCDLWHKGGGFRRHTDVSGTNSRPAYHSQPSKVILKFWGFQWKKDNEIFFGLKG